MYDNNRLRLLPLSIVLFALNVQEKNFLEKLPRDTEWPFLLCFYILRIEGLFVILLFVFFGASDYFRSILV